MVPNLLLRSSIKQRARSPPRIMRTCLHAYARASYTHTRVYACAHTRTHTRTHAYAHVRARTHTRARAHTRASNTRPCVLYARARAHAHVYARTRTHTRARARMRTRVLYAHAHAHTHTRVLDARTCNAYRIP